MCSIKVSKKLKVTSILANKEDKFTKGFLFLIWNIKNRCLFCWQGYCVENHYRV
jgi:hypothetical protein